MCKRVRCIAFLLILMCLGASCSVVRTNDKTNEEITSISTSIETTAEVTETTVAVDWDSYATPTPDEFSDDNIYTRLSEEYIYKYAPDSAEGYLIPFVGYVDEWHDEWSGRYYGFADETGKIVCDAHYSSVDYEEKYSLWIARDLTNDECDVYSADGAMAITYGYNDVVFYQNKIYCFSYSFKDGLPDYGVMSIYELNGDLVKDGVEFPCDGSRVYSVIDDTHLFLCTGEYGQDDFGGWAYVNLESKELKAAKIRQNSSTFSLNYEDNSAYYQYSTNDFIVFKSNGYEYSEVKLIADGFYIALTDNNTHFIDAEGNILNQLDYCADYRYSNPSCSVIEGEVYILDREGILSIFDKQGNLERVCDLNGEFGHVDKVFNDNLIAIKRTQSKVLSLDTGEVVFENDNTNDYSNSSYMYFYDSYCLQVYDEKFNEIFYELGLYPQNLISVSNDSLELVGVKREGMANIYSIDGKKHIADVPYDENTKYYCFDSRTIMCFDKDANTTIYDNDGNFVFRYIPSYIGG